MKNVNKLVAVLLSVAALSVGLVAFADTAVIGNDTTARSLIDSSSGFTVIDMNHPASASGTINSFGYNASNMNPFSFVLVDGSNVVQWVSPLITPPALGVNTYTPPTPLAIQAGWNLGVYFSSTGTITFESTGANASWTAQGSGMPTATTALTIAGSGSRTYAFVANGTMSSTTTPVLTSVTVTPTTETLSIGGTQQLTASPMDQNSAAFSGATLSYMSSDTSVATVSSSGLVTAVAPGTATVTVTATMGSTSVTTTSVVTVSSAVVPPPGNPDHHDKDGHGDNGNGISGADSLRVKIILDMIKRLLGQLGITESFTAANGMTF